MGELDAAGTRQSSARIRRAPFSGGSSGLPTPDLVATEEPFEIRLGYSRRDGSRAEEPVSVTMRTPGHDDDLAVGFLFTEGIIRARGDVRASWRAGQRRDGLVNVVRVELAPGVTVDFKRLERNFYMTSSCGVCGKASIDAVAVQGQYDIGAVYFQNDRRGARRLPAALKTQQAVFEQTGGLHASGFFDAAGAIVALREDVGRHNALDKVDRPRVDARRVPLTNWRHRQRPRELRADAEGEDGGRPLVAAVGAPSSLAVELAREFGITLVGFLKADRFNVYSRPDRILQ